MHKMYGSDNDAKYITHNTEKGQPFLFKRKYRKRYFGIKEALFFH